MKPQQKQGEPKSPNKGNPALTQFLKKQKTFQIEYEIVKQLHAHLTENFKSQDFQTFRTLYNGLSKETKGTLVFKLLNYQIWNDQNLPVVIREKTQFFTIVSEWIMAYEMKVNDLKTMAKQVEFLWEFLGKETKSIFEKVVLIEEIHEDLVELLGRDFWGLQGQKSQTQAQPQSTKEQATQFLKLLGSLVEYYHLFQDKTHPIYNCELHLLRNRSENYKKFIYKSIQYVLSVNGNKKTPQKCLQKHQEMQLTRIALIFLQRPDLPSVQVVHLLKLLMLKTSRIVRYAMVVDYVRYYDYLEKSKQYEILQELEEMVYFRELVIGHAQIDQAGLITSQLGSKMETVQVAARTKSKILITHQTQFGSYSVFQLELLLEGGDINVSIFSMKNDKEVLFWKQERTEDRRVDIMIKDPGLYIVELDNSFSWLKGKKINYRLEQFCTGLFDQ